MIPLRTDISLCLAKVRDLTGVTCLVLSSLAVAAWPAAAQNRDDHYHPLSENSPPGQAAGWLNYLRNYDPSWLQPMAIEIPGGGTVEVYSGSDVAVGAAQSPALVAANAGHLYRFHISSMPAFPGVDLYPTVELLDHLHPPEGRANEFPIPIILTDENIRAAIQGQLVTRVIYLEQPQIAQVIDPLRREIPQSVTPAENALKEADRLGRPMAIIRIGGRRPSPGAPMSFYGTGGAVQIRAPAAPQTGQDAAVVRMRQPGPLRQTGNLRPRW